MKKIGLLGGTFNPPHLGHLMIAEECRQQRKLDEVWFIPTAKPPHKKSPQLASDTQRVAMLKQLIRGCSDFSVHTIELKRGGKSYTFDTVSALKKKHPECTFYFIIGSDMCDYFATWYRFEDLQKEITFITTARPGLKLSALQKYKDYFSARAWKTFQKHSTTVPEMDIASSDIRKRIQRRKPIYHLTGRPVASYISKHGLYS